MLTIKFTDGELVQNVGWNSLPNKLIQSVTLELQGRKIKMQGFEEYNHLQEKSFNVMGGITQLRAIYLMGRKEINAKVIKFDLITNRITESITDINKEYNDRPSTGWKKGICNETPQYFIT